MWTPATPPVNRYCPASNRLPLIFSFNSIDAICEQKLRDPPSQRYTEHRS